MPNQTLQACARCWRRKQKCSREVPTCVQCRLASTPCHQRRFGSIVDASNPGSGSFIESLKNRIQALEIRVAATGQTLASAVNADDSVIQRDGVADASLEPPPSDLRNTMQQVSYLSLSEMAGSTDCQFSVDPQGLSFLTLLFAATSAPGSNPSLPVGANDGLSTSLFQLRKGAFPHGINLQMVDSSHFFQCYVDTVADASSFMTTLELNNLYHSVMAVHDTSTLEQMANETPEKLVIVYVAIATGMLSDSSYTFTEVFSTELVRNAVQLMPRVFDHASELSIVRCLTALTIYSMLTAFGGSTWYLLGLAMTRSISYGMHTSRPVEPSSDLDGEDKTQMNRVFWTLYILDTHVSTNLDRPFCVNDQDIVVSAPSSPPTSSLGVNDAHYRLLLQHAQIQRSIRHESGKDILCHFINLRHWHEMFMKKMGQPSLHSSHLYTRGLIEILKIPTFLTDADSTIVLQHAEDEFCTYLDLFEKKLNTHAGAPASLDGLHIFAIGITLAWKFTKSSKSSLRLAQCIRILTLLSTRYAPFRCLRDTLTECQSIATNAIQPPIYTRLRELVSSSEIAISCRLQTLMFGSSV